MATGSYFIILRTTDIKIPYEKETLDNFCVKFKERNNLTQNTFYNLPEYMSLPLNLDFDEQFEAQRTFSWVSTKTYKIYDELFKTRFISGFDVLKKYYNLDTFNNTELEITYTMAANMKTAIDYLLNRDYSIKLEDLLDNGYIRAFGELLPSYEHFITSETEYNIDYTDCFEVDGTSFLKKFSATLSTFLTLCNEDMFNDAEYKLIYHVW